MRVPLRRPGRPRTRAAQPQGDVGDRRRTQGRCGARGAQEASRNRAAEDVGWEGSTWSGEEGRWDGGGGPRAGSRGLGSGRPGLSRAVCPGLSVWPEERRGGPTWETQPLGALGTSLCSCCSVRRAETSFRGDWCLGAARQDGAVDSSRPWQWETKWQALDADPEPA